jgi:ribosomal-protein-alanine N-acetyltransferase
MEIRLLQLDDAPRLLAFEVENRHWFERFVEARAPSTYASDGINAHLLQCLAAHERGTMLPFVMLDADGRIVGRANLKEIDRPAGAAEIGYRIAEKAVGQGLATRAVRHLVESAAALGLERLVAVISVDNGASAKVVERAGFVRDTFAPAHAVLLHGSVDCWRYVLTLAPPAAA